MAIKLFYTSPNTFEWTTEISNVLERDEKVMVTLKETAFYPIGGGQPYDLGTINGIKVVEVYEENEEVFHVLSQKPNDIKVHCKVESLRRIDHTQHHTGQHLLSAVCIELFNAHTLSFHLGIDTVSIDLDIPKLTDAQLLQIEKTANHYIYDNIEVNTYFVNEEELHTIPLRKVPDVHGDIRIVDIKGIDLSACCGTHVSRTGEIGMIKLLKTEKHRGNTRLYFKCGLRALNDYQEKHEIISYLSKKLSTSKEELIERIHKQDMEKKDLQKKLDLALLEKAKFIAAEIINTQPSGLVYKKWNNKTFKEIQKIAMEIIQHTNQVVMVATSKENKLFLIHNGVSETHCGKLIKGNAASYNGKGGGDNSKAQATFQNEQDMCYFIDYINTLF